MNIECIEKFCSTYNNRDGGSNKKGGVSGKKSKVFGTGVRPKKDAKYLIIHHAKPAENTDDGRPMWICNYCPAVRCKPDMQIHHRRGRCAVLRRRDKHFQITPRNIPRGFWSNDTTQLKVIRPHDTGNKTRYTLVQGGEEFSCVIQTSSPTAFTTNKSNQGTDTFLGKAWEGMGHSGDEKMLVAARECVMFNNEIDEDDNPLFVVQPNLPLTYLMFLSYIF